MTVSGPCRPIRRHYGKNHDAEAFHCAAPAWSPRALPRLALQGCAVASIAGAAAGAAISVGGAVVSAGVKVTGKVIEKAVDVAGDAAKDSASTGARSLPSADPLPEAPTPPVQ